MGSYGGDSQGPFGSRVEMTDSSRKTSDSARPVVILAVLVGVCGAALVAAEILVPGSNPIRWSWWLYGIGGVVIFILLSRKRKQSDLGVTPPDQNIEPQEPRENPTSLDDVRRSIRNRKQEKREKK